MKTVFFKPRFVAGIMIASIVTMLSCQKNISGPTENSAAKTAVNIYLQDDPSLVFDQLWLDIQKLEIKAEDDSQSKHESEHQGEIDDNDKKGDDSGGWMTVAIHPGLYNILQFRNGLDTLFASTSFPAIRQLRKLRITLGNRSNVVFNGTTLPLQANGDNHYIVIKLDGSAVNFNSGGLNNIWIDIDASQSVRKHGNDFELKPQVKLFSKDATGRLEGRALPAAAKVMITAMSATDTATAIPEREGEFKITGLKPGNYTVMYHATAGSYTDTTLKNIIVQAKEDSKLPAITLHP